MFVCVRVSHLLWLLSYWKKVQVVVSKFVGLHAMCHACSWILKLMYLKLHIYRVWSQLNVFCCNLSWRNNYLTVKGLGHDKVALRVTESVTYCYIYLALSRNRGFIPLTSMKSEFIKSTSSAYKWCSAIRKSLSHTRRNKINVGTSSTTGKVGLTWSVLLWYWGMKLCECLSADTFSDFRTTFTCKWTCS